MLDEADYCHYLCPDGGRKVLVNGVSEFVNQDVVGPEVGVILITQDVVLQDSAGVTTDAAQCMVLPVVKSAGTGTGAGTDIYRGVHRSSVKNTAFISQKYRCQ